MAGELTRTQIENEALDNAAKSGALTLQSSTLLSTRVTTWVNRAQHWIARRADLLQATAYTSTVASQQSYSFPGGFRNIYTLKFEDGQNSRKLKCILPWQFDKYVPLPSNVTTGYSEFYVPYKETETFELFPIPQGVYTIRLRYSYYPTNFTSATAVSQYTNCDDALVAYTTMMIFRWLQELKDANEWEKLGDRIVDTNVGLADDEQKFIDWTPIYEGYSAQSSDIIAGDYVNNPFVSGLNSWWR